MDAEWRWRKSIRDSGFKSHRHRHGNPREIGGFSVSGVGRGAFLVQILTDLDAIVPRGSSRPDHPRVTVPGGDTSGGIPLNHGEDIPDAHLLRQVRITESGSGSRIFRSQRSTTRASSCSALLVLSLLGTSACLCV